MSQKVESVLLYIYSYLFIFEFVASGLTHLVNADRAVGYYSLVLLCDYKSGIVLFFMPSRKCLKPFVNGIKKKKRQENVFKLLCKLQTKVVITSHSCLKQTHQSTDSRWNLPNRLTKGRCAVNKASFSSVVLSHFTMCEFGCCITCTESIGITSCSVAIRFSPSQPGTLVGQCPRNAPKLVTLALNVTFNLAHFYGDMELMRTTGCHLRRRVIAKVKTFSLVLLSKKCNVLKSVFPILFYVLISFFNKQLHLTNRKLTRALLKAPGLWG